MPHTEGAADLERLLAEHGERLMRTAVLLAGSHTDGQDLLQGALERLLRTGRRIEGSPESYLRRLRDALMQIMRLLPPQQRAVIVLRYWEQLSQAETAGVLGLSEGTVKSAASRGLRRMRDLAGPWHAAITAEEAT